MFFNELEDESKFDMDVWLSCERSEADEKLNSYRKINQCGYSACAIGWTPSIAGMPEPDKRESWREYGIRVYRLRWKGFGCCFDEAWASIDNTPKGAAARMQYLLDNEDLGDWEFDKDRLIERGVFRG